MKGLLADLRHALRIYVGAPIACVIAVVSLAVAMAFVGAFLALYVDMVSPHEGFEPGGRLVTVIQTDGVANSGVTLELIERANEDMTSIDALSGLGVFFNAPVTMGPDRESVLIAEVTREFFPDMRPRMALGRGFRPEDHEPDAEPVVIISYPMWRDLYDGNPDVLGTMLELRTPAMAAPGAAAGGEPAETITALRIVGVISPQLSGTSRGETDLWVPYERFIRLFVDNEQVIRRNAIFWTFFRRSPGVPDRAVVQELNARYVDSGADLGIRPGFRLDGIEGVTYDVAAQRQAHRQLQLFLGGSVLLALVAASNVSLFLLARAPTRRRELGIRMSVGASLHRLARQLATEAGLLVVAAALLGLLFSAWLGAWLQGLAFLQGVEWRDVSMFDWRVLVSIVLGIAALTLFVALAPIQGLRRMGVAASSRQVAARATPAQRIAGTVQVAIACTIGGAAIAFGWHLGAMMFGDPGYETRNLHVATMSPRFTSAPTPESLVVSASRRREAIAGIQGVSDLAFGTLFPGPGSRPRVGFQPDPRNPGEPIELGFVSIDDRYVDLLGIELLHGRVPERNEPDVTLVNQTLAQRIWGRDNVVGERLTFSTSGGASTEIVGVLADFSYGHPMGDVTPTYFPTGDGGFLSTQILIESTLTPAELQQALQGLIGAGELEEFFGGIVPLETLRAMTFGADRVRGLLTITTAVIVVILACFGFFGTQRYLVAAGRREYAIRASLGAGPRALGRLVLARGLALAVPGLAAGVLLSYIVVGLLREEFVSRDVSALAVSVIVAASIGMLLVAASVGPAHQARRTQPAPLLRED